jgi:hypothetical protein
MHASARWQAVEKRFPDAALAFMADDRQRETGFQQALN